MGRPFFGPSRALFYLKQQLLLIARARSGAYGWVNSRSRPHPFDTRESRTPLAPQPAGFPISTTHVNGPF
jgi:hypothetical protein